MLSQLLKLIGFTLFAIGPAVASVSIYMPPEQLASRADLVVEATVARTASGFDPVRGTLRTYVTLAIDRVHRGPRGLEHVVIREPGGRYGDVVHAVDAVPVYTAGERVIAFLEAGEDGALRTTGMFYGKFGIEDAGPGSIDAVRDLEGRGTILHGPEQRTERIPLAELQSIAANVERFTPGSVSATRRALRLSAADRGSSRGSSGGYAGDTASARPEWTAEPSEFRELVWGDVAVARGPHVVARGDDAMPRADLSAAVPVQGARPNFVAADAAAPTRWLEPDYDIPVLVGIRRAGNPLGDGSAAVAEMQRAMAAWTDVSESRLVLQAGNTNYDYTGVFASSPAVSHSGVNVILFGDPYDDISDPSNCGGVLAIGGYWRSTTLASEPVNGKSFYRALQAYVIFNNGFECFLGYPDNLAEVAAHELGHAVGFGHSSETDAIMRSFAYGFRGPRLGDDDRDAAHCHYPHTLEITRPDGGEVWAAGSLQAIEWSGTAEHGPDPGTLDIEYSTNGGNSWIPVASGTPNDGAHTWLVPQTPGNETRVRIVRYPRGDGLEAGYPEACSGDGSDGSFTIAEAPQVAGAVPDGSTGNPLRVAAVGSGQLRLSWDASCSADADDYAVYEGSLASLRAGAWDHQPVSCAGTDVVEYVNPQAGNRYFLVSPLAGTTEGDFGVSSSGSLRPESTSACGARQAGLACGP